MERTDNALSLQPSQLVRVLQGVVVATRVSPGILDRLEPWIRQIEALGDSDNKTCSSLGFRLSALSTASIAEDEASFAVASLTITVAALQQQSRSGATASESELSFIWDTIRYALATPALQDSWSPSRSAQGFLSVPLCSITKEGRIDELFRLHVWLPDSQRGNPDFAIHSHQPFAQSWILAGEGIDHLYQVERPDDVSDATHAEYHLSWNDGKSLSKAYSTHQHSSVVVNSGIKVRPVEVRNRLHKRNDAYTIPSAAFHRTEVSPDALHATLFYFDSHRGFVQNAPVLGPINGEPSTQIRDPAGQKPNTLAAMVTQVRSWEELIEQGRRHAQRADWESAQRAFNDALSLCTTAQDFPNPKRYRGLTLGELGSTNRRFGRYAVAEGLLKDACNELLHSPEHAAVCGELGVVYRHMNRLEDAKYMFHLQYSAAKESGTQLEMCRAVGNLGMVSYQVWETSRRDTDLELAIGQLRERVELCRTIQTTMVGHTVNSDSASQLRRQTSVWAAIGLARLSLCFAAKGNANESYVAAADGLKYAKQTGDPTVVAISQFFTGKALTMKGETKEALLQFNTHEGCTPAMAFCKEPSQEHHRYLEFLVDAGADMDLLDNDGYTALDYAIFNGDKTSTDLVLRGLRRQFMANNDVEDMILQRQTEGRLRKGYRELFQEKLRPVLLARDEDCIQKLRGAYADALAADPDKRDSLDSFKVIAYPEFDRFGRMPRSSDGIARPLPVQCEGSSKRLQFVIFFSYRWLCPMKGPGGGRADDANNTQYRRMMRAISDFLDSNSTIKAEDLYIWMDFACINQDDSRKGVAALPMLLAQCDAVISLVDDQYFDRAWCSVEAMMIQKLARSYSNYTWLEQPQGEDGPAELCGKLRGGPMGMEIRAAKKKLSFEEDRVKIVFLERQSTLLA